MNKARILVIGRSGQVAQALAAEMRAGLVSAGRPEIDLADKSSLQRAFDAARPALVLNAGAYTSVDGAESEPEAAAAINATGPAHLAEICAQAGVPLIHLSTDCEFDGAKPAPYVPEDAPNPISVYGRTKLAGVQAVAEGHPQHLIVRVSWIFSRHGSNFVRTMLNAARTRDEVVVVNDQIGNPTHAPALAAALLQMADAALAPGFTQWGTYHLAGAGETDRASLTRAIYEESQRLDGPVARVRSVPTSEYPTPAARPLNARLDMTRTTDVFGVTLPDWRCGLPEAVAAILKETA